MDKINFIYQNIYYILNQLNFPYYAFFNIATTLLWTTLSIIPATVNTPPIIAQIYTKKWKILSLSYANLTVTGDKSYLK